MELTGITPILNVSDVPASLRWFEALGFRREFTFGESGMIPGAADADASGPAGFASVCAGAGQIFLCRDGQGLRGGKPPVPGTDDDAGATWMSLWVRTPAEVDEAHRRAVAAGITVVAPPGGRALGRARAAPRPPGRPRLPRERAYLPGAVRPLQPVTSAPGGAVRAHHSAIRGRKRSV